MTANWDGYAERRVRSSYRSWQRLRRARTLLTGAGVTAVLVWVALQLQDRLASEAPTEPSFIAFVGVALVAAVLLPRVLARLVWNLLWRYRREEWE